MQINAENTWLLADPHLGHNNIIKYCKRPFKTVEEMDETILANINSKVKPKDLLISLGDFSFTPNKYIDKLNCNNLIFIKGNHDFKALGKLRPPPDKNWRISQDQILEVKAKDDNGELRIIVLCHYPLLSWHSSRRNSYHFHGHCHFAIDETKLGNNKRLDVGVDANARRSRSDSLHEELDNIDPCDYGPILLKDAIIEVNKRLQKQENSRWRDSLLLETFTDV